MKVTVSRTDLRDAIARVIPAVAVKPSVPVIAGIYMKAEHSGLTLRATNFNLDITAKIPANVETAGDIVATGKFFSQIVNKLGGEIVTLSDANNQLTIRSDAASFDILTMDAGDFPSELKLSEGAAAFRIRRDALKDSIRKTVFACAKEDSRPVFAGVNFTLSGTDFRARATNASRIAFFQAKTFDAADANIIVHANALRALQNALGTDSFVTCEFDSQHATFSFDNIRFTTRLINGNFPPADKLVPQNCATTAEVEVSELRAAIERMQVISTDNGYNQISMAFTQDGLAISTSSDSIGKAIENVDADVTGSDAALAFNCAFILDVLKVIDGFKVQFGINEPLAPAKIIDNDDPDFVYVVTPLRTHA